MHFLALLSLRMKILVTLRLLLPLDKLGVGVAQGRPDLLLP